MFGQGNAGIGLVDAFVQFGMAGAVLLAGAGFIWYLERREKRIDVLDDKRTAALNGLTAAVEACTRAVVALDAHMREVKRR